ncbi:SDR family oxidoreductase [Streptomyces sp. JW3]|uniref:SDR family oxidoreductase n=1 Tax=Streptomyces sp. JW3 TaxID=3456955 RepID=UPI003FA4086A
MSSSRNAPTRTCRGRRPDSAGDLRAAYGERFRPGHLDVTDLPKVREVVDAAFTDLGRTDVAVNSAGYGLSGAAGELSDGQVLHGISTNFPDSVRIARAALAHLRAQGGRRPGYRQHNAAPRTLRGVLGSDAYQAATAARTDATD